MRPDGRIHYILKAKKFFKYKGVCDFAIKHWETEVPEVTGGISGREN